MHSGPSGGRLGENYEYLRDPYTKTEAQKPVKTTSHTYIHT